jgi:subtilisin family serine protease
VDSEPDTWDDDGDGYLDPVAGHGTFIAGIIEMLTPGCALYLPSVMGSDGVVEDWEAAGRLEELEALDDGARPDLVSLSFAGYLPFEELLPESPASAVGMMAEAIQALLAQGSLIVASAGNDGTAAPTFPAAYPGVIAVAALDERGHPAPYTNHGPWVDACAVGSSVVSLFFEDVTDREREFYGIEPDTFEGWARWSGTSFAAPKVVAALAGEIASGRTGDEACEEVLGPPSAPNRYALLGTVVAP